MVHAAEPAELQAPTRSRTMRMTRRRLWEDEAMLVGGRVEARWRTWCCSLAGEEELTGGRGMWRT